MSALTNIIKGVVNGEHNFCCCCLAMDPNNTISEINIISNEEEECISLSSILLIAFGSEMQDYMSTINKVCDKCLQTILSIHKFIENCHNNSSYFIHTLDRLSSSLNSNKCDLEEGKSLIIAENEQNRTFHLYYDSKKLESKLDVLQRWKYLSKPKITKLEIDTVMDFPVEKIDLDDIVYDIKEEIPRCKECLKPYSTLAKLKSHFFRIHAPKYFQCPKCPKTFSLPNYVTHHLRVDHCEMVCSECGKVFHNLSTFRRHEMSHLPLVCEDCGRTYKSNVTFRNHIQLNICKQNARANPANAQFTCDYCGKRYTQKMSLRVHIQYTHGNYKAHECGWCGKKFWAQSRLQAHIVKHTKEKKFTCSMCQSKFVTKESLLYHTRLHTGEKPYNCTECNSNFISASRRAYHMKKYHLRPTVKCESCHAKFTSRTYLDKHKKYQAKCRIAQNANSDGNSNK